MHFFNNNGSDSLFWKGSSPIVQNVMRSVPDSRTNIHMIMLYYWLRHTLWWMRECGQETEIGSITPHTDAQQICAIIRMQYKQMLYIYYMAYDIRVYFVHANWNVIYMGHSPCVRCLNRTSDHCANTHSVRIALRSFVPFTHRLRHIATVHSPNSRHDTQKSALNNELDSGGSVLIRVACTECGDEHGDIRVCSSYCKHSCACWFAFERINEPQLLRVNVRYRADRKCTFVKAGVCFRCERRRKLCTEVRSQCRATQPWGRFCVQHLICPDCFASKCVSKVLIVRAIWPGINNILPMPTDTHILHRTPAKTSARVKHVSLN